MSVEWMHLVLALLLDMGLVQSWYEIKLKPGNATKYICMPRRASRTSAYLLKTTTVVCVNCKCDVCVWVGGWVCVRVTRCVEVLYVLCTCYALCTNPLRFIPQKC